MLFDRVTGFTGVMRVTGAEVVEGRALSMRWDGGGGGGGEGWECERFVGEGEGTGVVRWES